MTTNMVQLCYCSKIRDDLNEASAQRIADEASANNHKNNISGFLYYYDEYFLQVIEGERTAINKLYQTLLHDSRHYGPIILFYKECHQRSFESWDMCYLNKFLTGGKALLTSTITHNNFYVFTEEQAQAFVHDIHQHNYSQVSLRP